MNRGGREDPTRNPGGGEAASGQGRAAGGDPAEIGTRPPGTRPGGGPTDLPAEVDGDRLGRLRTLARVLDTAVRVPGTRIRFGLDALLGLVPGAGDVIGAVLSGWIVIESARLGARAPVLARMIGNVVVEAVLGAVPGLGDLFDVAWKANARNVRLLERHAADPGATLRSSRAVVAGAVVALAVVLGLTAVAAVLVVRLLWALVS